MWQVLQNGHALNTGRLAKGDKATVPVWAVSIDLMGILLWPQMRQRKIPRGFRKRFTIQKPSVDLKQARYSYQGVLFV
jgi:hypothetical protein